jgi:hypothetical protein
MTEQPSAPDPAGAAVVEVVMDAAWLLAPLFLRDFLRLQTAGPGPGTLIDQPPAERFIDPWLMHSVRPDRTVLLTAAAADWPAWWEQAVDVRPESGSPRPTDVMAFSAALTDIWPQVQPWFDKWLARRRPNRIEPAVEEHLLDEFAERRGRPAAVRSMTVLPVPVLGSLFIRPEADRIVVSTVLRGDQPRYAALLDPVLADYFY